MSFVVKRSVIGLSPLDVIRSDETSGLPIFAPASHGMLRIDCQIEGDIILSATPLLGSMHRGAEKLFESRDYPGYRAPEFGFTQDILAHPVSFFGLGLGSVGSAVRLEIKFSDPCRQLFSPDTFKI